MLHDFALCKFTIDTDNDIDKSRVKCSDVSFSDWKPIHGLQRATVAILFIQSWCPTANAARRFYSLFSTRTWLGQWKAVTEKNFRF